MLFFNAIWDVFNTIFVFTLVVVIMVFILIIFFVYKFMNSNVSSKRSNWVKVETVVPKYSAEPSRLPDKEDFPHYCTYCGEKVSPQDKICQSCGAEV